MGRIRKYNSRKSWTKQEEELLTSLCEKQSIEYIAKRLGRDKNSVRAKRYRMGLSNLKNATDRLLLTQVAELVGIDKTTVYKNWSKYGLKIRKIGTFKTVSEKELLAFMKAHPERWKASECDYYFFCRHKWFQERLRLEKAGKDITSRYQNLRKWTPEEISRLKMLMKRGFSNREMAAELGRTKRAVEHVAMRMRKQERNKTLSKHV